MAYFMRSLNYVILKPFKRVGNFVHICRRVMLERRFLFLVLICVITTLLFFANFPPRNLNLKTVSEYEKNDRESIVKLQKVPVSNLRFLSEEFMRINYSQHEELIALQYRQKALLERNVNLQNQVEYLQNIIIEQSKLLLNVKANLNSFEQKLSELNHSSILYVDKWPITKLYEGFNTKPIILTDDVCTLESCINWDRCRPNTTTFFTYCIKSDFINKTFDEADLLQRLINRLPNFVESCKVTDDDRQACLAITVGVQDTMRCISDYNRDTTSSHPTCLGILLNSSRVKTIHEGYRANFIIAAYSHPTDLFRKTFDYILPLNYELLCRTVMNGCNYSHISLLPGKRNLLLATFIGNLTKTTSAVDKISTSSYDALIIDYLIKLTNCTGFRHKVSISFLREEKQLRSCWSKKYRNFLLDRLSLDYDWFPCEDSTKLLQQSTFGLIFYNAKAEFASFGLRAQLIYCLASGAIPVILTNEPFHLNELDDNAQLTKSVLRLSRPRVQEIVPVLESISESHIVEMRRQGQILFQRYFKDSTSQLNTFLLNIGHRMGFSQPPVPEWSARPAFKDPLMNDQFIPSHLYPVQIASILQTDLDDFLGPVGPQQSSVRFSGNFTSAGGAAGLANVALQNGGMIANPFFLFPSTPWDPLLPSDASFSNVTQTSFGLRPINHSINLAGYEFSMQLGGMHPYEQFTIVLLTYNRQEIVCKTLESFLNLPYLHSVLVIWNHPLGPRPHLLWPQLHAPVKVIHSVNNSLNNRFLPYDLIQTDAILSVDDDMQLRQDEIVFGFRVWREHRDQLVGYPARTQFWNASSQEWYYISDYTCEFSMILTGAAFFHKYYTFAYTWEMPFAIRKLVDDHLNCEDIAMNFLIAHLTRKPPIKVTLHWSFECPMCKSTLHYRSDHYKIRSKCINWFSRYYGYNPLVYTQFRTDSVLFKTRIPPNKQKCFKYV